MMPLLRKRLRTVHSPEHVEIALVPAGLGRRFVALFVDLLIVSGASGLLRMLCLLLPRAFGSALFATVEFILTWGYPVAFEVLHAGRTPGKALFGLRVVDGRGLPLSFAQSAVRNMVRALDLAAGLGAVVTLVEPYHRRLGDLAADTLVVEEQPAAAVPRALLEARRFNTLSTPSLRRKVEHRLGLEERELLLSLCVRAPRLSEAVRYELFEAVGEHYRRRLDVEDTHLSGEAIVRGLVALCYGARPG